MRNNHRFGLLAGLMLLGSLVPSGASAQWIPDSALFELNATTNVSVTQGGPTVTCDITVDETAIGLDVQALVGAEYFAANSASCGNVNLRFEYGLRVTATGWDGEEERATAADLTLRVHIIYPSGDEVTATDVTVDFALPSRGVDLWINTPATNFPGVVFNSRRVIFTVIGQ